MVFKEFLERLKGNQDRGPWQPKAGPFPRLMLLDEKALEPLRNNGGLYALWHQGVRPQWIYIGYGLDLAEILTAAQSDADVALYDLNEGVFVAWAFCPITERAGAVVYLRSILEPALMDTPLDDFGMIDPGTKPKEFAPPVD